MIGAGDTALHQDPRASLLLRHTTELPLAASLQSGEVM